MIKAFRAWRQSRQLVDDNRSLHSEIRTLEAKVDHLQEIIKQQREAMAAMSSGYRSMWVEFEKHIAENTFTRPG